MCKLRKLILIVELRTVYIFCCSEKKKWCFVEQSVLHNMNDMAQCSVVCVCVYCGHKLRLIMFNILFKRELYIVVIKKRKKYNCNIFHAT